MTVVDFLSGLTPFQRLSLASLGSLLVLEIIGLRRDPAGRRTRSLRILVWLAAAVAIAWPRLTTELAIVLGIGRGTDLVLYIFILAFLAVAFLFYKWSACAARSPSSSATPPSETQGRDIASKSAVD